MEYRPLGRTGVRLSALGLGTMMFGDKLDEADSVRMVHAALDAGVNLIDTADVYSGGGSERIVGKALKDRRHEAFLATKVRRAMPGDTRPNAEGLSRLHIMQAAEASLSRLGTDYIDLYQVHWADPDTLMPGLAPSPRPASRTPPAPALRASAWPCPRRPPSAVQWGSRRSRS